MEGKITAIILAGGEGRRFGAEKARLAWGHTTLLKHLVERLRPLADEILVSVRERRQAPVLRGPVRIVEDVVPDAHALGGLYSGLRAARHAHCLVWATDAPFVSATLVRWLYQWVDGVDLVIPCSRNGLEPLHAVYAKSALPVIEEHIRCGRWDLRALVPDLRATVVPLEVVRRLDPQRLSFTNINTPEDYQRAQAIHARIERGGSSTVVSSAP